MEHKLFTREIIAYFIETRLKHRLSSAFIITRGELIERFNSYAQDNELVILRMYASEEDGITFKMYYDQAGRITFDTHRIR